MTIDIQRRRLLGASVAGASLATLAPVSHVANAAGVPIVNYGVLIAYMQGILERCLEPFGTC